MVRSDEARVASRAPADGEGAASRIDCATPSVKSARERESRARRAARAASRGARGLAAREAARAGARCRALRVAQK
jgi:hypothetical protein